MAYVKSFTRRKKKCKDDAYIQPTHLEALYEAANEEYEERASTSAASAPYVDAPEEQLEEDDANDHNLDRTEPS